MKRFKLLVVGCGNIAKEHLKVFCKFRQFNISWVYSRNYSNTKKFAKNYKELIAIENLNCFLKNHYKIIDGVLVLVSPDQINKVALNISKFNIPLFIEKPVGLNLSEILYLKNILNKKKIKNMVGFNRRFYSSVNYIKKNNRSFGKLCGFKIECNERYWTLKNKIKKKTLKNWIYANSSHIFDIMNYLFGNPIEIKKILYKGKNIFIEKFVSILKFNKNIIGSFNFFSTSPGGWNINIYFEKITVVFEGLEKCHLIDRKFKKKEIQLSNNDKIFKPGFYLQAKFFLRLLKTKYKKNNFSDINSAYKTFFLIDKILK